MPLAAAVVLLLLKILSASEPTWGQSNPFQTVASLVDRTFAASPTLDQNGNHGGPYASTSPQRCAVTCVQSAAAAGSACSAFSYCEVDGSCDLLLGATLDSPTVALLSAKTADCKVYNKTELLMVESLASTSSAATSSVTQSPSTTAYSTTAMLMTTTTSAPLATAQASFGTLIVPSLNLTTYAQAAEMCRNRRARLVDVSNSSVQLDLCNTLNTMVPAGTKVWVHAWTDNSCGNVNQKWQFTVNPVCGYAPYISVTPASAAALCWQPTGSGTATFALANAAATSTFHFVINLAHTMSFAEASAWCSLQTGPMNGAALKVAKYTTVDWYSPLKTHFSAEVSTYPCNMHFWIQPTNTPAAPDCNALAYIFIDENVNMGNLNLVQNMSLCSNYDKFALCSDIPV